MSDLLINGFSNVSTKGVTLHFTKKVALHGGLSANEWWFSWDAIGQALFPDKYCELSAVDDRRRLRGETDDESRQRQPGQGGE